MKKYIIYLALVIGGLLLGYILFNTSSEEAQTHNHQASTGEDQMWTCSMHPQIMQPEPGDCPICGMELIPADQNTDGLSADQFRMTENAMALANIQTTVVQEGTVSGNSFKLSGKIRVNEEANAVQVSYFAGRIEQLYVNFTGQEVKRGQQLASIYSPELISAQQELLTAASLKESQPALYRAVRNKLKLLKISDSQIDAIEAAGEVRENFPVYANISGTVTEKLVQEGDQVNQGQPLYRIANLNTVWAVFDAYENQISNLEEGQEIRVVTNAYPGREFNATVSFIDPVLNTSTRTLTVRAELNNSENIFKPGMFVQGIVESSGGAPGDNMLTVPQSAVLWTGERSLVYVKTSPNEPVFELREIELGGATGENYQVLSGLNSGEEIVVNGTFTVDAAAQLQGKRSMMNSGKIAESTEMPLMSGMNEGTMKMGMELSAPFQQDFKKVLSSYFSLKDAFVNSDVQAVRREAERMQEKMQDLDTSEGDLMLSRHLSVVSKMLQAIAENESLENQRDHFVVLSENVISIASNLDDLEQPVFVQRCPMANNDKGANWLSLSAEIRNPYYGEAMLTCGETVAEIE